jgi:hypothetical protein
MLIIPTVDDDIFYKVRGGKTLHITSTTDIVHPATSLHIRYHPLLLSNPIKRVILPTTVNSSHNPLHVFVYHPSQYILFVLDLTLIFSVVWIHVLCAGQYSYFTTTGYPWVPIYYNGANGTATICSAD